MFSQIFEECRMIFVNLILRESNLFSFLKKNISIFLYFYFSYTQEQGIEDQVFNIMRKEIENCQNILNFALIHALSGGVSGIYYFREQSFSLCKTFISEFDTANEKTSC